MSLMKSVWLNFKYKMSSISFILKQLKNMLFPIANWPTFESRLNFFGGFLLRYISAVSFYVFGSRTKFIVRSLIAKL